jgi:hypothetical protein
MEAAPSPIRDLLHAGLLVRGGVYGGRVGHFWPDILSGGPSLCGAEGPPFTWRSGDWIPGRLCLRCVRVALRVLRLLPVPLCPSCHSIVTRPHCLFDLPPDECPRHALREAWATQVRAALRRKD